MSPCSESLPLFTGFITTGLITTGLITTGFITTGFALVYMIFSFSTVSEHPCDMQLFS
jgi:hypothetical protein